MRDLFKQLIWPRLIELGLKELFRAVPFLGWGPVGWITRWLVTMFAEALWKAANLAVDMTLIPIRNEGLRREYELESTRLRILAEKYTENSPEFIDAKEKAHKALQDFVRFNIA